MKWKKEILGIPSYHPGKKYPGTIKLSSNENPLGPSPKAMEAIQQNMESVHIYPQVVSWELCQAVAAWRGCSPDQLIFGNGSDEIFTLLAAAILGPGGNAVGSMHTFSQYEFATRLFGAEFRAAPTKAYRYDLDAIHSRVDSHTGIVFLCSPNNPTGMIIPAQELRSFLKGIPPDVLVVLDQAYREYVDSDQYPEALELMNEFPNLVLTGTFSKIFGLAALRIGYGIAQPEVIQTLLKVKSPFNNSNIAQAAAIAAVNDTEFLNTSIDFNRRSRESAVQMLQDAGIEHFPSHSNFLCVRSPRDNAKEDVAMLLEQGISVRDLSSFGMKEYLRITCADQNLMENIITTLEGGR